MEVKPIRAKDIKPYFQSLTPEELTNKSLLAEFIRKRVGIRYRKQDWSIAEGEYLPKGGFYIKMWADELAGFLLFLHAHKNDVNSYLEFGTGSGGTFYVVDSYLRTINPNMGISVTVDRKTTLPDQFEEYVRENPQVQAFSCFTQHFQMVRKYDLCFIDANHLYGCVKRDFEKVRDYCKFIAFHDIAAVNTAKPHVRCAKQFWEELQADHKLAIITDDPQIHLMAGIGVAWNDKEGFRKRLENLR